MGTLEATGAAPGPYWIAALAGDTIVATRTLEIVADPPAPRGGATKVLAEAPFAGAMPFPLGTTKFRIFNGAQMLHEVTVSANAPTVNNVTPATGGSYGGAFNITWGASDADDDTLTYSVEYNPDVTNPQSAWAMLIDGLTERQWAENFGELPGGAHAKVRVKASDGVLTGVAESAEFSVPFKAPEAFIQDPAWGYDYELGDEVELSVEAYDLQDEVIPDNRIQWSSNVAGALGSGADIIVRGLPLGEHVISARVTNSAGLSVTDSVTISMGSLCERVRRVRRRLQPGRPPDQQLGQPAHHAGHPGARGLHGHLRNLPAPESAARRGYAGDVPDRPQLQPERVGITGRRVERSGLLQHRADDPDRGLSGPATQCVGRQPAALSLEWQRLD